MNTQNGLINNKRKAYNISLLSSCGLVAISGVTEFEGLHEFAGYVFLALMAIHLSIYWKCIRSLFG
jgi:hypothetical protein